MRSFALTLLILVGLWVPARGDTLLFKNGDQLTGVWQRVDAGTMVFKSENLGDLSVPVGKVQSMNSTKPSAILLKTGEAYSGMLSLLESGAWELKGEDGGIRHVPAESVVAIYPLEMYIAMAGATDIPRPWQNWKGTGNVGYSLVRGERDAGTMSIGVNAVRRQPDLPGYKETFRTNYHLNMLFTNTKTDGVSASANSVSTRLRQDFLFTPTNFIFMLGQWEHIQTQSLDLRQTYGGGVGRDLLRRPKFDMQFLGGMTFVRESFANGELRQNAEALIGEKLAWRFRKSVSLGHSLDFYPNITEGGAFRVDSTTTLSTRISSRFSFNTTVADRFFSRPQSGRQRNELIFTTGLGFNF
jgi:putative salt-induced outer membrane protein YdiY